MKVGQWYKDSDGPQHRRYCIKALPVEKIKHVIAGDIIEQNQIVIYFDVYSSGQVFERVTSYVGWEVDIERGALVLCKKPSWKLQLPKKEKGEKNVVNV